MTVDATSPPRWDLAPIFPRIDSPELVRALDNVRTEIGELSTEFDARNVRRRTDATVDAELVAAFEAITERINALLQRLYTLSSYVNCLVTTDAKDDEARKAQSVLAGERAKLDPLLTRYIAWVGTTDLESLTSESVVAREHAWSLAKATCQARFQMEEGEERLAAELRPSSITGWARLHGNLSALLTADVDLPDGRRTIPIAQVRALANDPIRDVRRAAFEGELRAWETVEIPMAAAINGVKGYQNVVRGNRGYADDLEPTFLMNDINRDILQAMQAACMESFPDFRRYLNTKARALGLERLAWYDVNAPLGTAAKQWSWADAESFIVENFAQFSGRLADFAARAFRERWVDAEPRLGKQGGAYCTGPLPGVSRIMMNFDGSFMSVSTLAHELGHAYHNLNLADRTPLQRETPMTLAETASIFCETLSFEAALSRAERDEKIALLNTSLERDLGVVVDIHSRFLFESSVFELRASRDLTVSELKERMLLAQRETYGPDVEPLHPYMWAVKGHYYGPLFYNYPYTFGLLFGIGLYAEYQNDPQRFVGRYDDLLSNTGMADAATLAMQFGIDIADVGFWRSSLDIIRQRIAEFESITAA